MEPSLRWVLTTALSKTCVRTPVPKILQKVNPFQHVHPWTPPARIQRLKYPAVHLETLPAQMWQVFLTNTFHAWSMHHNLFLESSLAGKNPESANRSSSNPGVRLYTPPERATRYKLHEVAMKPPVSNSNAGRFEHSIPKRKLSFASSELRSHNVTPLNWSPMNTSCISFSKIVSSTPLSHYGDPRNMQPLDLSVSCSEESPLDCSLRNEEIEPMNLVVKIPRETRPLPSTYGALNFVCHDRRTPEKGLYS